MLNIYGLSKLQGENFIKKTLTENYIFRVASLFGVAGASGKGGNFVEAILKKALNEKKLSSFRNETNTFLMFSIRWKSSRVGVDLRESEYKRRSNWVTISFLLMEFLSRG